MIDENASRERRPMGRRPRLRLGRPSPADCCACHRGFRGVLWLPRVSPHPIALGARWAVRASEGCEQRPSAPTEDQRCPSAAGALGAERERERGRPTPRRRGADAAPEGERESIQTRRELISQERVHCVSLSESVPSLPPISTPLPPLSLLTPSAARCVGKAR